MPLNLLGGLIDGKPIFPGDFADPYPLAEPKALFIHATNTTTANVPVTRILVGDAFDGDYLGDAIPTLPSWTVKGFQWVPSVWARSDGRFVLYCSTAAPAVFAQPMSSDGPSTAGPPVQMVTNDQSWEGAVVEGPSMVGVDGRYELFYSANNLDRATYSVGIALCETVTGPCTKPLDHAWLVSAKKYTGTGGQERFDNPGGVWMVHHGFLPGQAGSPGGQPGGQRRLHLDLLRYSGTDAVPTLGGGQRAEEAVARVLVVLGVVTVLCVVLVVVLLRPRRKVRAAATVD